MESTVEENLTPRPVSKDNDNDSDPKLEKKQKLNKLISGQTNGDNGKNKENSNREQLPKLSEKMEIDEEEKEEEEKEEGEKEEEEEESDDEEEEESDDEESSDDEDEETSKPERIVTNPIKLESDYTVNLPLQSSTHNACPLPVDMILQTDGGCFFGYNSSILGKYSETIHDMITDVKIDENPSDPMKPILLHEIDKETLNIILNFTTWLHLNDPIRVIMGNGLYADGSTPVTLKTRRKSKKSKKTEEKILKDHPSIRKFMIDIAKNQESVFKLTLAANYLAHKDLFAITAKYLAWRIANRLPEQIMEEFEIDGPLTPHERQYLLETIEWIDLRLHEEMAFV